MRLATGGLLNGLRLLCAQDLHTLTFPQAASSNAQNFNIDGVNGSDIEDAQLDNDSEPTGDLESGSDFSDEVLDSCKRIIHLHTTKITSCRA